VAQTALTWDGLGGSIGVEEEAVVVVRSLEDARGRELVRRVLEQDEMAFRDLFRRYAPVAKSLAIRIVRQAFLAEEIVQEAFLSLWRDPRAYKEDRGSFRTWLMSAVHHRAVDAVRREETQRKRGREELPDMTARVDVGDLVAEQTDLRRTGSGPSSLGGDPVRAATGAGDDVFRRQDPDGHRRGAGASPGHGQEPVPPGMRRLRAMLFQEEG
jgi:RNA polymerase sigma factor (sigma-70 family)